MMNLLKIKFFFSPVPVVLISMILSVFLFKILADSNQSIMAFILFYTLFLYWISALVFIVSGFLKNRRPI